MTDVWLVRHGEAAWESMNARNLPGAINDLVPLTAAGMGHADQAAEQLRGISTGAVVSSPMTRALQTAATIAARSALPLSVDFELREWLVDDTYRWDAATAASAYPDFIALDGEWPSDERRAGNRFHSCGQPQPRPSPGPARHEVR